MASENHYDVLGVPRDASAEQIRAAYRERAQNPPAAAAQAEGWWRDLRAAYDVLSDPSARAEYDAGLGAPANGLSSAEALQRRLVALEGELARARQQRDEYRRLAHAPPGPVDLSEDWLKEPPGTPIAEVLDEYEARLKAGG